MKKILSLVLALAITLSLVSNASAIEIVGNNNVQTPAAEGNWELCSWLTDKSGYFCAQKYGEADDVLAINETANAIAGIVGNGKVQRAHARHYVTIDEINWVDLGDSEPIWCRVEFLELDDDKAQAEFDAFGITTCEELEDSISVGTVIETDDGEQIYIAYYRCVEIRDLEETELDVEVVARVYVGKQYFHVLLVDYDQDGDRELALHLGLKASAKPSGGNNDNDGTDDEGTDDEGTDDEGTDDEGTDDEGTKPGTDKKPDPENDDADVVKDLFPELTGGSSNTSNSTSTPSKDSSVVADPKNDDVVLGW